MPSSRLPTNRSSPHGTSDAPKRGNTLHNEQSAVAGQHQRWPRTHASDFSHGDGDHAALSRAMELQHAATEAELMRELIFCLNGASGTLIQYNPSLDAFVVAANVVIAAESQDDILRIAECGWLHNRIRDFIDTTRHDRGAGSVVQSLATALQDHLTEYYHLVAMLEAQLHRDGLENMPPDQLSKAEYTPLGNTASADFEGQPPSSLVPQSLTLARLQLWLAEPKRRLKQLASLCDVCRGRKGGALASEVYDYLQCGNIGMRSTYRHLMVNCAGALHHFIGQWVYDGNLNDPNQEFFVAVNPSVKDDKLWYEKYNLRKSMIPRFIDISQAKQILLIGKSVNFLLQVCGEMPNVKDHEIVRNSRLKTVDSMFEQVFSSSFGNMISTAYYHTSRHLLETLFTRYHFMDHLRATRRFLLLGQGDFIQRLMDLLDTDLAKPATELIRHHLSGTLETAIRDTNAQYEDSDILQRLDVRLMDISSRDVGWDVFSLEYIVDGPLVTIFTPECRLLYLKAFNFLWRAKRMEFSLNILWKHQLFTARLSHGVQEDLSSLLHLAQLLGSEIRHFVQQLQYYISFEVLECAWELLVKKINLATDLDQVISAHQAFITNVIIRCLLDAQSRQVIGQLRTIFDLIISFVQLHQELNTIALKEMETRRKMEKQTEATYGTGKWGTDVRLQLHESSRRREFIEKNMGPLLAKLRVLASSYRGMVIDFLSMLNAHPDASLRFLSHNLNYNSHYQLR